uniref:Lipid/polyisoprenoid-binding YceI-like domain-containing protein n=1 Tax=mine drainage metagenome TaxID=410659 RepID=E6QQ01_9ZZZZ
MKKIHQLGLLFCIVATLFFTPAYAQWQLENDHSNLNFISIKKTSIAEVHQFKKLSGSVSDEGDIHLVIDLSSVDTQNDLRNERLKVMLFEVARFPTAEFNGNIDMRANCKIPEKLQVCSNAYHFCGLKIAPAGLFTH